MQTTFQTGSQLNHLSIVPDLEGALIGKKEAPGQWVAPRTPIELELHLHNAL